MSIAMACQVRDEVLSALVIAGLDPFDFAVTVEFNHFWGGYSDYCLVVATVGGDRFAERIRFKDLDRRHVPQRRLLISLINRALQQSIYG